LGGYERLEERKEDNNLYHSIFRWGWGICRPDCCSFSRQDIFVLNNYLQGKLVAFGSADHIKKKFGVGYTLILQSKWLEYWILSNKFFSQDSSSFHDSAKEITSRVQNVIPSAYLHGTTTLNLIKYSIPFDQSHNLPILFSELEKIKDIRVYFTKNYVPILW